MSYVMYDSNRLIPAPFVNVVKQYERNQDGTRIGSTFHITVTGWIIAYMGSPKSDATFWNLPGFPPDETITSDSRLGALLRKEEAIRNLFSQDGLEFEVQSGDGSQPMKCNPNVVDINFAEGLWFDRVAYTINLECTILSVNGVPLGEDDFDDLISTSSEQWSFETDETPEGIGLPRTYRLIHNISATGKRVFDESGTITKPAWQQAQSYVLKRLGFSTTNAMSSGVNNLPSYYGGYNYMRSNQQDELNGSYSVTENWILASGKALEDFTCDTRVDASTGVTNVSIQGTITGLEERDSDLNLVRRKFANADTTWSGIAPNLLLRAQQYSQTTLNTVPLSRLVGKNDINGIITYSYEYDTRPSNLFSGVNYEGITISENRPADLFSVIPVIGRAAGPVLQDLTSKLQRSVTLNIELIVQPNSFGAGSTSEVRTALYGNPRITQPTAFDTIYQAARPGINYGTNFEFVSNESESFEIKTGRYSYTVEWTFGN